MRVPRWLPTGEPSRLEWLGDRLLDVPGRVVYGAFAGVVVLYGWLEDFWREGRR